MSVRRKTVSGAGPTGYVYSSQIGSLAMPNWPADPTPGNVTNQGYLEQATPAARAAAVMKWQFQYHS